MGDTYKPRNSFYSHTVANTPNYNYHHVDSFYADTTWNRERHAYNHQGRKSPTKVQPSQRKVTFEGPSADHYTSFVEECTPVRQRGDRVISMKGKRVIIPKATHRFINAVSNEYQK